MLYLYCLECVDYEIVCCQSILDSTINPELAKLYQPQLNSALIGQQPQLSPALLTQPPQPSSQCLTLSPCSLSPALSTNPSPQHQMIEEPQRGRRSSRTRFTEQQLETLQGVFEATPYPREEEYDRLSALLSLPNRVIVVWFQNARQRARKNQDRGSDDGAEGKSNLDNINRQRDGFCPSPSNVQSVFLRRFESGIFTL
uniref:Homeobox domain-containing protein n=1 Tax=Xiphophorus couchianus TaxID=32473 RepID=A0A3B5M7A5_9TELE